MLNKYIREKVGQYGNHLEKAQASHRRQVEQQNKLCYHTFAGVSNEVHISDTWSLIGLSYVYWTQSNFLSSHSAKYLKYQSWES